MKEIEIYKWLEPFSIREVKKSWLGRLRSSRYEIIYDGKAVTADYNYETLKVLAALSNAAYNCGRLDVLKELGYAETE